MGVSATSYIPFLKNQGGCSILVIVIKALCLKTTESVIIYTYLHI